MSDDTHAGHGRCPDEDELVELALGQTDRRTGEGISTHLATCAPCRRSYDDLAGAVELVLPAVPRVAPPPGFEAATLEQIRRTRRTSPPDTWGGGISTPPNTSDGGHVAPPSTSGGGPTRRTVLWAAAAAVLGAATGAGVTASLTRDETPSAWSTPLVTADGQTVGVVSPSYGEQGSLLVVDVAAGDAGRTYTCRLRRADESTEEVGVWTLAEDRPNSWVVAVADPGTLEAVELVGSSGAVWAEAVLQGRNPS